MTCSIRYTPQAMQDLNAIWDAVYEASVSFDIADHYMDDFMDEIASAKELSHSGIPLCYRGLFTGFYSVNLKKYKVFYRVRGTFSNFCDAIR